MGNKKNTMLFNNTNKVMVACEFSGIYTGKVDVMGTANAHDQCKIDKKTYKGTDSQGGLFHAVMIFCDGRSLQWSSGQDYVLRGEKFFSYKTVTIDPDQNSPGFDNFEVKFGDSANSDKVKGDLVFDHDNGWSVQHSVNGIVTLTREEGMTLTLDPSKLFACNIVRDPPETLLLNVFLKFWPRTFADLSCKDDLGTTIRNVNYLMRQAKFCHANKSELVEVDSVVEKVKDLHKSCAAMVEWYRPLFPNIPFTQVAKPMAEVDKGKLDRFAAYSKPLLKPPNSLPGRSS